MYNLLFIFTIVFQLLFFDWHARMVFMARAYVRKYGHGKSWKRAHKHYKSNWNFVQRLLWVPMFKEVYESKHKTIAYLSFVHYFFAIATVLFYLFSTIFFTNSKMWIYEYYGYSLFGVFRFIYDNAIARGEI